MSITTFTSEMGLRLHKVRTLNGLSQVQMAEKLNVSARTYQGYERGERDISAQTIHEVFSNFGTDPLWLVTGIDRSTSEMEDRLDILEQVIVHLDERLENDKLDISGQRRAKIVKSFYSHFLSKREFDEKLFNEFYNLATI